VTTLRCPCGTLVEGTGDELLTAVEAHIETAHPDCLVVVAAHAAPTPARPAASGPTDDTKGAPA
jgi:hypothetical protein